MLASGSSLAAIKNLPSANLIPSFSSTLIFESPRLSRYLACIRQLVAGSIGVFFEVDSLRSSLTVPPLVHFVPSLPRVLSRKIRRAHGLRHLPTDTGRHKIRCRVLSWLSSSLGHRSFPIPIVTTTTVQCCSIVLRLSSPGSLIAHSSLPHRYRVADFPNTVHSSVVALRRHPRLTLLDCYSVAASEVPVASICSAFATPLHRVRGTAEHLVPLCFLR